MRVFISLIFLAVFAFANVATVVDVVGEANINRAGKTLKVILKLELKEHDVINTGHSAKVKIFFKDNTAVSLGKNTTFAIDKYLFTGKKDSEVKFKVLKGFFKTVTGKIGKVAPERFKLQTKNATIGIRGTVFAAEVSDKTDVVMCTDGTIVLFTPDGAIEVTSGYSGYIGKAQKTNVKQYSDKQKAKLIQNAGWHGSMSLNKLIEFIKNNFKEPLRSQLLATVQNIYDKDSSENSKINAKVINADDKGFVDDITINKREFDELPQEIEFYQEDLKDGKIIVQGLLESVNENVHVDSLHVEITTDGGDTWSRAKGHGEWEWSYAPELEKEYEFSLRIVQDTKSNEHVVLGDEEPEDVHVNLGDTISIAGFKLTLNADVSLVSGKLSGSGKIEIPYLSKISNLSNEIDVDFQNLSVTNNIVTIGDITYDNSFTINTPLAKAQIDKIVFSAIPSNNKLVGKIVFNDELATSFDDIVLPNTSKFLPTSFSLNIPFEAKTINIWREKGVLLYVPNGALNLSYNLGDELPKADFDISSAQFKFGQLLTYSQGVQAQVGLGDFGKTPTIVLPNDVYLLDTGIKIPQGFSLNFDLNDYTKPKFSFSSSVNLDNFTNEFAQNLTNANLSATVSKTGFSGTLSGNGGIEPVTILERGSVQKDVRLVFEGQSPSFSFNITNEAPSFSLSGVTPKIYFGDLFTDLQGQALNKVVSLGNIETPTLNLNESIYLLGSKIKLPSGFNASVDLSDFQAPILTFDVGVDFNDYSENIIAKHIKEANIKGVLSQDGFNASVTAPTPTPIDIYTPNNVKLIFNNSISFGVNISGTETLPEFSITNIDASLDFGSLLTKVGGRTTDVIASIGTITQNNIQALSLSLPAKVKLLDSNLAFDGIISSLNLQNKNITIDSSVDLNAYTGNTILNALNGSKFNMSINPTSFNGTISVEDNLDPISIWAEKDVSLNISGKPTIGVNVDEGGVSFDFGELNAEVNFGTLLTTAQNSTTSAVATFSKVLNDAGKYSVKLQDEVYLLGSKFALKKPEINFNPNIKSISLNSSVNLSQYTEPMIKAFNGATFSADVSSSGFSGSLSKEGGFEPIVVLERGGVGKDVSIEFTASPIISVEVKNSGVDFGFSGGDADIHFGDLLNNATVGLKSLKDGFYSWELEGKSKLYSEAKAYIEDVKNAKLNLQDFSNPKIFFDANVDLSEYKGVLTSVKSAELKNVVISKSGFKASLSASLGKVDIWKEKNVYMDFTQKPTINISLGSSGFDMGFSKLSANLNFGDLLDNAQATIGDVLPEGDVSSLLDKAEDKGEEIVNEIVKETALRWNIARNNISLYGSKILLSELGGSIELSDFSNPKITLNGLADLSEYGTVFEYVKRAGLDNVTISKDGFSGSITTSLQDIKIWREKNVKVVFNKDPKFNLKVDNSGLKLGVSNISASVHLGSLLNERIAQLKSLENDIYSWNIDGKNKLADTSLYLERLKGKINFADLKNPKLIIKEANIDGLDSVFKSVSLKNAKISKEGFDAYVSASMDDLEIYKENSKKIELKFKDEQTPTLHVKLNLSGLSVGLSNFNANLKFTNLLDNQSISLSPIVENGVNLDGNFKWELLGKRDFLSQKVVIENIFGSLDLSDWKNPVAIFRTTATFDKFEVLQGMELSGIFDVTRAEVKKTSIKWNVSAQNARVNTTILELGEGANDDVRVELKNVNASAGNDGVSINGADGTLFFGKLFSGNKSIGLTLSSGDTGLKTYGFSFSENLVYKQDDDNFITLKNPSGNLIETSEGVYKVVLNSQVLAHSAVLSAISIGELSAVNLEISSSGFKGDVAATFENISTTILSKKASIGLTRVGFHIDSSKTLPISLNEFIGDLDISSFFDAADAAKAKATLAFVTDSINWTLPVNNTLHVNQNFEFKNLSGNLDLSSLTNLSIGVSGDFSYKGIDETVTLDNFKISSEGLDGTIAWDGKKELFSKLYLKSLGVTFAGVNTQGNMGVLYEDSSFLSTGKALNLSLSATIDKNGVDSFGVNAPEGQDVASIDVSNFAIFNFTGANAAPSFDDFWLSLDGNVKLQHSILSANTELNFKDLKISQSGVSVKTAGVLIDTASSASLGGLQMQIKKVGMGIEDNLFYVRAVGDLSLVVASVENADVSVYSNKTVSVNKIHVDIKQSGLVASGNIAWYDKKSPDFAVYGNGFGAELSLGIAKVFTASGKFRVGQKDEIFYWMANASGGVGSGVNFGPLTMYEVGGGVAYHMIYDAQKKDFIPAGDTLSLMLNTKLGTSDGGYMWHGDIKVIAAIQNNKLGQLNLTGDSWILSDLADKPAKQYIDATITYSDTMFQATAGANIKYKGISVNGKLDAVISSNEKHLFIGTDSAYSFAFNGYKELGHVEVGLFGFNGYGFFMVSQEAIAFGEGVKVNKKWSKDWWGPDPSLRFKLNAGVKALFIYRPFQFMAEANVEVTLAACYGGCLEIGADAKVNVAIGNLHNYVFGAAGIRIFGTSIHFDGYLYGSGTIQTTPKIDIDILDKVTPTISTDVTLMPLFKIYSKFQNSTRGMDIEVKNLKLIEGRVSSSDYGASLVPGGNTYVDIALEELPLEGDYKGAAYMLKSGLLKRNTTYTLVGTIKGTYQENGKSEYEHEVIHKVFKTTSEDKISFEQLVSRIYPNEGANHVNENSEVSIYYNKKAVDKLAGGVNSKYYKNYFIKVLDADNNEIVGQFTEPTEGDMIVSKFKPSKKLRIYRYCVNENGDVRETFIVNGKYLNPFNDFTEDDGVEEEPSTVLSDTVNMQAQIAVLNNQNDYVLDDNRMRTILLAAQETQSSSGGMQTQQAQLLNQKEIAIAKVIPRDLLLENKTFLNPNKEEALGTKLHSSFSRGKSYTYYRANMYKIKVFDKMAGDKEIYTSKFEVAYNNTREESKRKVQQMEGVLNPTITVSFDENRIGANGGIFVINNDMSQYNDGFFNEMRYEIDNGLLDIYVTSGIRTKVIGTFEIQVRGGSTKTFVKELNDSRIFFPGIIKEYSVKIEYSTVVGNHLILTKELSIIPGDPFNAREEAEKEEQMQKDFERVKASVKKGKTVKDVKTIVDAVVNGYGGGFDGGFSQVGGGANPISDTKMNSVIINDIAGKVNVKLNVGGVMR